MNTDWHLSHFSIDPTENYFMVVSYVCWPKNITSSLKAASSHAFLPAKLLPLWFSTVFLSVCRTLTPQARSSSTLLNRAWHWRMSDLVHVFCHFSSKIFHSCNTQRRKTERISFICPNGTIYSQMKHVCDWWYK